MAKCIYQRGDSFQVKVRVPSQSKRVTATFPTLKLAQRFLDECKRKGSSRALPPPLVPPRRVRKRHVKTIQDLFEVVDHKRWQGNPDCKHPRGGSAENALRFIDWVGPTAPVKQALSEYTIAAFFEERERLHSNSGSTINRYRAAISCLVKEALKLRLLHSQPELPRRREGRSRDRIFTPAEEAQMLNKVRALGYEDHAELFVFQVDTGCRCGETQKLIWRDFVGNHIHLEADITKNSTRRTLTATPRAAAAVRKMRDKYVAVYPGPFTWADPNLRRTRTLWSKLRQHFAWMDDCVIHTFRHTCASRLVQSGIDLYRVQIWMGHKTPQMTQRYAKFAPDQLAELAEVLAGYEKLTA